MFDMNPKDWIPLDTSLLLAYRLLEAERCPRCGKYIWECHDDAEWASELKWNTVYDICNAEKTYEIQEDSKRPVKERAKKQQREKWGKIPRYEHDGGGKDENGKTKWTPTREAYYEYKRLKAIKEQLGAFEPPIKKSGAFAVFK